MSRPWWPTWLERSWWRWRPGLRRAASGGCWRVCAVCRGPSGRARRLRRRCERKSPASSPASQRHAAHAPHGWAPQPASRIEHPPCYRDCEVLTRLCEYQHPLVWHRTHAAQRHRQQQEREQRRQQRRRAGPRAPGHPLGTSTMRCSRCCGSARELACAHRVERSLDLDLMNANVCTVPMACAKQTINASTRVMRSHVHPPAQKVCHQRACQVTQPRACTACTSGAVGATPPGGHEGPKCAALLATERLPRGVADGRHWCTHWPCTAAIDWICTCVATPLASGFWVLGRGAITRSTQMKVFTLPLCAVR